jgi:hypothetical protein
MGARPERDREVRCPMRKLPSAADRRNVRLAPFERRSGQRRRIRMTEETTVPTRRCSLCKLEKPLSAFPFKDRIRGTLRSYCWDCCRAYARAHYAKNRPSYLRRAARRRKADREACRTIVNEYLASHPCVDCGETDPRVLDFDHRDRSTKIDAVAGLIRRMNIALVLAEIAKCDVRCANDHRRKTARELGWSRLTRDEPVK